MLPGKRYKPEDFLWILWHRKWLVIVPTVIASVATFAWSSQLPNRYRSTASVLVVPQRVPEQYVRSTVTASVAERLNTIAQQILSRTRLERIIEEFNLYREERQTMIMEDVIELMRRRDIRLDVGARRERETSSFTVSFDSDNPRTAMQVAERLASMFVQENLENRELLADSTNQFLQAQLEDARRRLVEHETKLEAFKQRNAGRLPTQVQSNLQMMQITQSQIQTNTDAATRERDRLRLIEDAIADLTMAIDQPLGVVEVPAAGSGQPARPTTTAQELANARATLRDLERRFKPNHPDIGLMKRNIQALEARLAEETPRTAGGGAVPAVAANTGAAAKLKELNLEAEQLRRSLEARKVEDERLRRVLDNYRQRLEVAPQLESELTELMRDYNTLEGQYTALLRKSEESKIAVNLERRQIGEQFKIIDGARLPERPFSPNRQQLNLMGLLGGLGFGLALIALVEYRDTKLRTDNDVVTSLALPVLAVIPRMVTAAERRRAKRRRLLVTVSTSLLVVIGLAAIVAWQMRWLQDWVR